MVADNRGPEGEPGGGSGDAGESSSAVPLEVLERKLVAQASLIAAAEAEWLRWLGDYDAREGWASWGCVSTAQWLSWKCGITGSASRERVRVARALRDLPLIAAEFGEGRLTWSKVRALTRVASEHNEADLVAVAASATGAQLERICRGLRPVADESQNPTLAFASRAWTARRNFDGTTTFTLRVTDDAAAAITEHLERHVGGELDDAMGADSDNEKIPAQRASSPSEANETEPGPNESSERAESQAVRSRREVIADRGGIAAVRADVAGALLTGASTVALPAELSLVVDTDRHCVAESGPAAPVPAETPTNDESPVPAETRTDDECPVPAETPTDDECPVPAETPTKAKPPVPAETRPARYPLVEPGTFVVGDRAVHPDVGRRLCCDPRITAIVESALGSSLGVGRTSRLIPRRLRRALERRDSGCCQFPGCEARRRLHAHHIVHWADGGPTELENLVLLCHFHHHVVHDLGWRIDPVTMTFIHPTKGAVPSCPDLTHLDPDDIDPAAAWAHRSPARLEPLNWDRLDLAWVTAVIADNEALARSLATNLNRMADGTDER